MTFTVEIHYLSGRRLERWDCTPEDARRMADIVRPTSLAVDVWYGNAPPERGEAHPNRGGGRLPQPHAVRIR